MNKKKKYILLAVVLLLVAALVFIWKYSDRGLRKADPAFSRYISAFTSGIISSNSSIRIRLVEEYSGAEVGESLEDGLFDFSPNIKGKAYWIDNQTIEFKPEELLKSGQLYEAEFKLIKLLDVESNFEVFTFHFQVIQQSISVNFTGIELYNKKDLKWQIMKGVLYTSDVTDNARLELTLAAIQKDKNLTISWTHEADGKTHYFRVDSVSRTEEPGSMLLKWDGEKIGTKQTGELSIEVPALGDFKVIQALVVQQPEQYVSIIFSDPLDETQNLNGLVVFKNNTRSRTTILDNEIRLYPNSRQQGTQTIYLYQGIKNILGYKTKETQELEVFFEDIKPALEMIGKGVIMPTTGGIKLPFRSVNLKAVKVKIVQIYENNVAQFLQINQLDGEREIKRVGRVVHNSVVSLTSDKTIDYGKWNTFSLSLDKLIAAEPGAIYRVILSFTKKESLYPCATEDADENNMESTEENDDWEQDNSDEYSYWGGYEDYYYYEDENYNERENPCHNSYYKGNKTTRERNILASDLGIIAKSGADNKVLVTVSDLSTAQAQSGVDIEILNFQQQVIAKGVTDSEGMIKIDVRNKPYLLVAKKGKQRGYLRMDDGSSLSLSKFDVSGEIIQKGIKGFIYGERGVWRPGDSLFLSFILEDRDNLLPKSHPVIFELINPDGKVINKITKTSGVDKFYDFRTKTDDNAPTGNWTAKVQVGGASFQKTLKIEAIKPNRLKINLDFGTEKLTTLNSDVSGKLKVKWLHGAIAKNLKADVEVTTKQTNTVFKKYEEYNFDDPALSFESEEQVLFSDRINQLGEADISANIEVNDVSPGMLNASFKVKVYEESGDFSIDRFTIPYAPYESFAGVKIPKGDKSRGMLLTDTDHKVQIVTLDANGKPVSREDVRIELYKVNWRWWWEKTPDDELSRFVGSSGNNLIASSYINTVNGEGVYNLNVKYPDWGRFYIRIIDPISGHSTGQTMYIDWPGWAGRAQKDNPGGASMLMFATDKDKYKVGEKATVTVPTSGEGRMLVSIESGSKVIDAYWIDTQKETTVFDFEITDEMAPNAYINITLVQPHNSTANDLPIRLYGIMPLMVEDPQTLLHPILTMPDELQPEKKVNISVAEQNGKAMTYTIAMVDEGLLDLTRFKTPDPWNHFYAREALGVKTWDLYELIMGSYAGEIAGLLEIGGDGEIVNKEGGDKANRFKPMVKFLGPFELKAGQSAAHSFTMPQYVGSVRTMLIAGKNKAYGSTEKTTPVRQSLMVLATLPRVIGPGEKVKLPVTVFAMKNDIKNVTVEVKTNKMLQVNGSATQTISFSETGDKIVDFDLLVPEKVGKATVEVTVKSGNYIAKHNIEIQVRNPNPPVTNVLDKVIEAGQNWNADFTLPGMNGTNSAVLEVSTMPSINLDKHLKYLIRYPHGCVEQTTSAGFPQIYLAEVLNLDDNFKTEINKNIMTTVEKLQGFQLADGGFSYWQGNSSANDWCSSYVGHFLIEARKKGYTVPQGAIDNWVNYQKRASQNWLPSVQGSPYYYRNDDFVQAYRLYTLALAGRAEMGAMNRLKEKSDLSIPARWRLAAAYQLSGQRETAQALVKGVSYDIPDYNEMSNTYGSADRDKAMILETLTLMGEKENAALVLKSLAERMGSDRWMSTQTTAFSLLAVAKFMGENKSGGDISFAYSYNGESKKNMVNNKPISQVMLDCKKTSNSLSVENSSNTLLFVRVIMQGTPTTGDQTETAKDLEISVKYFDMKGNPLTPEQLKQGSDFKAEVSVKNPGYRGNYKEMALTQIFPSGWEIHNTRMDEAASLHQKSKPDYVDFRDDRVYYYFDLNAGQTKTFVTLLNASYSGKYYLPTIYGEAMYDNTINARKPGQWVEVVR